MPTPTTGSYDIFKSTDYAPDRIHEQALSSIDNIEKYPPTNSSAPHAFGFLLTHRSTQPR